jgi:hypothetical protein
MSSGAVIGGFAAAFGTASALGVIGIVVHVCQHQPTARSRLLARRRSFVERARRRHFASSETVSQVKALELEDVDCFCPQLRYLGPDKEPLLVRSGESIAVCLSDWLQQRQRVSENSHVCIDIETSWNNLNNQDTVLQRKSQNEVTSELVNNRGTCRSSSAVTHQHSKPRHTKGPLLVGRDIVPDELCAICLESVEVDSLIRVVKCGHAFHSSCILHWLTNANRCPLCNTTAVNEEDKKFIELRRSTHGTVSTPSVWPFPQPKLTEDDKNACLFRSLEKVLSAVQFRCSNE